MRRRLAASSAAWLLATVVALAMVACSSGSGSPPPTAATASDMPATVSPAATPSTSAAPLPSPSPSPQATAVAGPQVAGEFTVFADPALGTGLSAVADAFYTRNPRANGTIHFAASADVLGDATLLGADIVVVPTASLSALDPDAVPSPAIAVTLGDTQYSIALLSVAPAPQVAQAFIDFVLSPLGQDTLRRYGFGIPR